MRLGSLRLLMWLKHLQENPFEPHVMNGVRATRTTRRGRKEDEPPHRKACSRLSVGLAADSCPSLK